MTQPAIPQVGKPRPIKVPTFEDRTLRNGLRVLAIRRPSVPRVEVRLRIPAGLVHDRGDGGRARLLPETMLTGTTSKDSVSIARELQRLGASLEAHADPDDLLVHGGVLSGNLDGLLALMAEVLREPTFPTREVAVARDRVAQEIIIQRSQPQALAAEAMAARLYGSHRYGRPLPKPEAVRKIGRTSIASYHSDRVAPRGSTLVLVGDLTPRRAIDLVEASLSKWRGRAAGATEAPSPPRADGTIHIVDRPGSVQTNVRLGGVGLPRSHPEFFKLALANMVFGGYFTSRLTTNIREDKGYTYGGGSAITQRRSASILSVGADVRSEVTAATLMEIRYELTRMTALPVDQEELDAARRYMGGVLSLAIQTQAGMANYVDSLIAAGLDLEYLRAYRSRLDEVTTDDVLTVGRRYLSPRAMVTVLVGDASEIAGQVEALDPVKVVSA